MPNETAVSGIRVAGASSEWSWATFQFPTLRRSDWLLIIFFTYVALLGQTRGGGFAYRSLFILLIPTGLVALAALDARSTTPLWSCLRDWAPAPLVLLAYWTADWFGRPPGDHPARNETVGRPV